MMETSLLCDEELFFSSPVPQPAALPDAENYTLGYCCAAGADSEDALQLCLRKQQSYRPRDGYRDQLRRSPQLSGFRLRVVRWIIMARVRLNLVVETTFYAVNYLDRFISLYSSMKWELWMMELLSIACLLIAAKFDGVHSPHEFPIEDLDHSFQLSTIHRMEMVVLRVLDWRLNCVTTSSFVDLLTWCMHQSHHPRVVGVITDRITELLMGSLLDEQFTEFNPCIIALSAVRCAVEEHARLITDGSIFDLVRLIPQEHMVGMGECHESMKELVADPHHNLAVVWSPAKVVLPPERMEISDDCVDIDTLFRAHGLNDDSSCRPRKQRKVEKWTTVGA